MMMMRIDSLSVVHGDWTAYLDYNKVETLSQHDFDGKTCIIVVRAGVSSVLIGWQGH